VVDYSIDGDVVAFDVAVPAQCAGECTDAHAWALFRVRVRSVGRAKCRSPRRQNCRTGARFCVGAPGQYSSNAAICGSGAPLMSIQRLQIWLR
jgi:hypothetical protein